MPPPAKERFFEQIYQAGEQCQFDFKEKVLLPFKDDEHIVNLHFGTLPHSDFFHISGYRFKTWEAFAEGMHCFFDAAGGIPENVRIDNLSPCVKKVLKGKDRIYTDSFNRAIEYYGFNPSPCSPGKGSDKGDVEREIKTHANRIIRLIKLEGIQFDDIDHLNKWLAGYCAKRLKGPVTEKWKKEISSLKPVPPRSDTVLYKQFEQRGSAWGTVRDQDSKTTYSVPDSFIGKICNVSVGSEKVKITCDDEEVFHSRQPRDGRSILLKHILPSMVRKPSAMIRWTHRDLLFPTKEFENFLNWLGGEKDYQAIKMYLKIINLTQLTTLDEIRIGMILIQESGSKNPFEDIKELLLNDYMQIKPPRQVRIIPNLSQYDELIPRLKEKLHETPRVS